MKDDKGMTSELIEEVAEPDNHPLRALVLVVLGALVLAIPYCIWRLAHG